MHMLRCGALALALISGSAFGFEDVEVGMPLARFGLLKDGTHHYLRYLKNGDVNAPIDIWARTVQHDTKGLHITQRWDGNGTLRLLDSWFDEGTFRPRTHERISEKEGKRTVEQHDFASSPEPTFNFETDMEFLQALPLAKGYEARIKFYHPGGSAPAYYTFKVAGEQSIAGPTGPVECWLVTADYNRPGYVARLWFAKSTQVMVRQESPTPDGKLMIKALID